MTAERFIIAVRAGGRQVRRVLLGTASFNHKFPPLMRGMTLTYPNSCSVL